MIGDPISLLMYSESGAGKTFQLAKCLEYLRSYYKWQQGQPSFARVVSWDSTTDPFKPFQKEGSISLINANKLRDKDGDVIVMQTLHAVARGWWPVLGQDGKYYWNGPANAAKGLPSGMPQDNGVKVYATEGVSELAAQLLVEHGEKSRGLKDEGAAKQAGKYALERLNETEDILGLSGITIASGEPTMQHYGKVHNDILMKLFKEGILSLNVDVVITTMHTSEGEDDFGQKKLGPGLPGKAGTPQVMQKFGHCVHLDFVPDSKDLKAVNRYAFTERHYGFTGTNTSKQWPAKVSMSPEQLELWLKQYPGHRMLLGLKGIKDSVADLLRFLLEGKCGGAV